MANQPNEQKQRNLIDYCELFASLKVNKSKKRGEAPYKPILLLSIIDLIAQGAIKNQYIYITDELIENFKRYWNFLNPNNFGGGLALPFFHLKNDQFWQLKFSDKYSGGRPQTIPKLKNDVDYAILDQELFYFLQDQESRKTLVDALIFAWFSSSQKQLEDILSMNEKLQDLIDTDNREMTENDPPKTYLKKSIVRNAFFRKAIVHIYGYRCSLCGLKVTKTLTQNIVDGAHIKPLAQFYDNRVNNGLSLCKNHHWAFDNGLFTINDDYQVIVSKDFQEESPNAKPLQQFYGESIILPISESFYPSHEAIRWHQKNIFRP